MAPPFPRLYAILDRALLTRPALELAGMLADAGVELFQVREKGAPARELYEVASRLAGFFRERAAGMIVNDRADVAALAGARGVHVGQDDLPVEQARAICGAAAWVGVSTHTLDQVRQAERTSADYIAVGPIFATGTKQRHEPVVGVEFIRQARGIARKPLVAIGGITLARAEELYRAGADSLAVARDLIRAEDPAGRARAYLRVAAESPAEGGARG
jgi:thiamine-phosphate pyrophosphorylase